MINIGMLLKKYESLDDRSVKLIFLSQDVDVDGDAISQIMRMQGKYLQVAIIERDEPLKESEVPDIKMSSNKSLNSFVTSYTYYGISLQKRLSTIHLRPIMMLI